MRPSSLLRYVAVFCALAFVASTDAQTLYWNPSGSTEAQGGTGTWSTSTSAWNSSATPSATLSNWTNGNSAIFAGTAGTITNDSALTAGTVQFAGDFMLTGSGSLAASGGVTVTSGTLVLQTSYASPGFTIASGAVLDLNVASGLIDRASTTFSGDGTLRKTGAGTVQWGSTVATFALGAGSLIDVQGGTFTGGSNANENWINNESGLNVAVGAIFHGVEANVRVDALTGAGTIRSGFTGGGYATFTFGVADGSGTFSGVLVDTNGSHPGSFTKTGSGAQILTGANTFTGPLTIGQGTVQIGAGGTTGSLATSSVVNEAVLVFDRSDATSYSGVISGAGSLTQSGDGTLTLSGANTYSGDTYVDAGTLALANTGGTPIVNGNLAIATGATVQIDAYNQVSDTKNIHVNGGTLHLNNVIEGTTTGGLTLTGGNVTAAGDGAFHLLGAVTTNASATTATISAPVQLFTSFTGANVERIFTVNDGSAATDLALTGVVSSYTDEFVTLRKEGAGNLLLSGANTYNGTTLLYDGTLTLGSNSALGDSTLQFRGNGTLSAQGTIEFSKSIILQANGIVDLASGNALTLSGSLSESGARTLAKNGAGTLTLSVDNNFSGGTVLNAGTLVVGSNGSLGSGTLTINGGELQTTGTRSIGNALVLGADLTLSGADNLALTGGIGETGGARGVTQAGTGTVTLSSSLNYTGATTVTAGTLTTTANDTLPTGGTLVVAGGTFDLGTRNQTVGALTVSSGSITGTTGTLTSATSIDLRGGTIGAILAGSNGLAKTTSGTATLNAANLYTGSTTLTEGTLVVGSDTALSTGTLIANGGTLQASGSRTLANNVALFGAFTVAGADALTLNGNIGEDGANSLTKSGTGTLTLTGTNTYSGGTFLNDGVIAIGAATALGSGALTAGGGTLQTSGTFTLANAVSLDDDLTIATTDALTLAGIVSDGSGAHGLAKSGAGSLAVTGNNTHSGSNTLDAGTLIVGSNTALGSGSLTINGGELQASGTRSLANAVTLGANSTISGASNLTLSGNLGETGGVRSLTKSGTGSLTLSGANAYSGGTFVSEGTLALGANDALLTTGALTVNGGTFALGAFNQTAASVSLQSGAITGAGGTLTSTAAFDVRSGSASAALAGSNGLVKSTAGTVTLSGANTYTGGTFVNDGTLALGADDTLLTTGAVTVNGGTLDLATYYQTIGSLVLASGTISGSGELSSATDFDVRSGTVSGVLSGTSGLVKSTAGTVTLSGANFYTGTTTIDGGTLLVSGSLGETIVELNAGTLTAGAESALDYATINLAGGTLSFGDLTAASVRGLSGSGNLVLENTSDAAVALTLSYQGSPFSSTYSGVLSGAGSLHTYFSSDALTLTGDNTYSGGTTLEGGRLIAGSDTALGTGTLTFAGGALEVAGTRTLANAVVLASDASLGDSADAAFDLTLTGAIGEDLTPRQLTVHGEATRVTLTGNNTYSGGTVLASGTVVVGSNTALGSGALTAAGGQLEASGTRSVGNAITLANDLGIVGSSDLTLTGVIAEDGSPYQLAKSGTGTLTLTAANTYTGGSTLSGGTLIYGAAGALGTGTVTLAEGDVTLQVANTSSALTLGNAIVVSAGSGAATLSNTSGGSASTYSGAITLNRATTLDTGGFSENHFTGVIGGNVGTLSVAGAFVVLSGANTFTGNVAIGDGATLQLKNAAALPTSASVSTGTTGILEIATHTAIGDLAGSSGSFVQMGSFVPSSLTIGGKNTDTTFAGTIRNGGGSLSLVKTGTGTLTLSGANTYTGATTINDGTLQIDGSLARTSVTVNGGALALGHSLALQAGSVNLAGTGMLAFGEITTAALGALAGSGNVALVNTATTPAAVALKIANNSGNPFAATTYSGALSGAGSLEIAGSANLTLTGNNSYTGGTTLSGGTLVVGSDTALGSGTLSAGNGTLRTSGARTLANNIALTGNFYDWAAYSSYDLTLTGNISESNGAADFYFNGDGANSSTSRLTLSGNNTLSGRFILNSGTVVVGSNTAFGTASVSLFSGNLEAAGTRTLANDVLLSYGDSFFQGSGHLTLTGAVTDENYDFGGPGNLIKAGTGTLVLTGAASYTGTTAVNGGTLQFGKVDSLYGGDTGSWTASNLTVASGATAAFNVGGAGEFTAADIDTLKSLGSETAGFKDGSFLGLDTSNAPGGNFTYSSDIANPNSEANALGLVKFGSGTLTLSGNNSYTGGATLAAGTLALETNFALGSGPLTVNAGLLALGATFQSVSSASLVSGSISGTGLLMSGAAFDVRSGTISAPLFGGDGLVKSTSGTVTLSAENFFYGNIIVNGGTLLLDHSLALQGIFDTSGAGALSFGTLTAASFSGLTGSGNLALLNAATTPAPVALTVGADHTSSAFAGSLSGGGTLIKAGNGTLTLSGANTYSGGTTVSAGTLALGATNSLSTTGALTVNGGTFDLGAFNQTVASASLPSGAITGTGTLTSTAAFDVQSGSISAVLAGTAGLAKTTAGTVTLSGANTFTGATVVNGGSLILDNTATGGAIIGSTSGLTIGNATVTLTGASADAFSAAGVPVTLLAGGTLVGASTTNNFHTLGELNLQGGTLSGSNPDVTSGNFFLNGRTNVASGDVTSTIDASVLTWSFTPAAGGGRIFDIGSGTMPSTLVISSDIRGTALTKRGVGTLRLTGQSTLSSLGGSAGLLAIDGQIAVSGSTGASGSGSMEVTGTLAASSIQLVPSQGQPGIPSLLIAQGGTVTAPSLVAVVISDYGSGFDAQRHTITRVTDPGSSLTLTNSNPGLYSLLLGSGGTMNDAVPISGLGSQLIVENGGLVTAPRILIGNAHYDGTGPKLGGGTIQLVGTTAARGVLATSDIEISSNAIDRQIIFDGGILRATADNPNLIADTATITRPLSLLAGGGFIDTNGHAVGITQTIDGGGDLTKQGTGTLTLSGASSYEGGTTLAGGVVEVAANAALGTSSGTVTFTGGTLRTTGNFTAARATTLDTGGGTFEIASGTTLTWDGAISGAAGNHLTKIGEGVLLLGGTNTYAGDTNVAAGGLKIASASAFSPNTTLHVAPGAFFDANGFQPTFNAITGSGQVDVGSAGFILAPASGLQAINVQLTGSGGLTLNGGGTVELGASNSFQGAATLTQGTLKLGAAGALPTNVPMQIASGASLDLNGHAATVGRFAGAGNVALGSAMLTIAQSDHTSFTGAISGSGGLTKSGAGTLTLGGTHTFSGATNITGGRLHLTGSAASSAFTVSGGGILSGTGAVGALTIASGGTLSPGSSPGLLTVNGDLSLMGTTLMELAGTARGTTYDATDVLGSITFGGTLQVVLLDDFSPLTGATFNLFDWAGSASGAFATLDLPALSSGLIWDTSTLYADGVLGVTGSAVPEPSTYATIFGACALGLAAWRKRRRSA